MFQIRLLPLLRHQHLHLFTSGCIFQLGYPGRNKWRIWIDGGIHAREWIATATVISIAQQVQASLSHRDAYVCLSVCMSVSLIVFLCVCLSVCMSVCLSVCLIVCLYVCLYVCLILPLPLSPSLPSSHPIIELLLETLLTHLH